MSNTPKTLNVTECHQLLNALLVKEGTSKQFRKGIRNYCMALLMLDAGLRVGEVVKLTQNDLFYLDEPVRSLLVRAEIAKNKTERTVPLSERICQAVREMHKHWWKDSIGGDWEYAFYQTDPEKPVTTRQVERIIRAAAEKSIGHPVHPHVLRHTFGTRIERKAGIRIAQECLGHSSITSTQIYTHPNEDDKKKAVEAVEKDDAQLKQTIAKELTSTGPANSIDTAGTNTNHR